MTPENLNANLAIFRHIAGELKNGALFCAQCGSYLDDGRYCQPGAEVIVEAPDRPELPRDQCKVASYKHPGLMA